MVRAIASLLGLAVWPTIAAAQSAGGGPGPSFRPELDNDAVTVVRVRMAPHAKTPEHDVTPRVVVWLTDAHLRLTFPDGSARREDHRAGDVAWVPAMRHVGENLGDRSVEFIAVIPKSGAAGGRERH